MNSAANPACRAACSLITVIWLLVAGHAWCGTLAPDLSAKTRKASTEEEFAVIVRLRDTVNHPALLASVANAGRAVRQESVIRNLRDMADRSQHGLKKDLAEREKAGKVKQIRNFWIFNGFALTAPADVVQELAARDDVAEVVPDRIITMEATATVPAAPVSWNLNLIGAPALWNLGFRGQGVVVASLDTGVAIIHPALKGKWRGGTNSWYDPYRKTTDPYDLNGHGTGTMGIMVGGNTTGNPVGVAPGALWIAAKIYDDSGNASLSNIHAAFQWILDPDDNPATADAPDVVNNSWDLGNPGQYSGEFSPDIQSLTAAGIAVVFSAGNGGPPNLGQSNTSVSPGNNPGALPVGATSSSDQIASFSSRGPSAFDGASLYPLLVAPGVFIRTADLNGTYSTFTNSGTSLAAAHVSGAVALLLSGRPVLLAGKPDVLGNALTAAAQDLGPTGPDNTYGYGRLDAANAVSLLGLTPPALPTGDVNGDGVVDIQDALLVLQAAIGLIPATPLMMQQGDVAPFQNAVPQPDGVIDGRDALVMLEKVAGVLNF